MYQSYEMKFLKTGILFDVTRPINLIKTKYNYLIKELYQDDIETLNFLFGRINFKLKTSGKDLFLNGRDVKFVNENNEVTPFIPDTLWRIRLMIQGYKTSACSQVTPIWKIDEAIIESLI